MNLKLLTNSVRFRNHILILRTVNQECTKVLFTSTNLTSHFYSTNNNKNNFRASTKLREVCKRLFSTNDGPPENKQLPPLMNFPEIVWPSLIKSIRTFILSTFIIKPYMDREFNIPDFIKGSKKALQVVSQKLAVGDLKALEGLVSAEILPSLHQSISIMSLSQREQLAVDVEDVYFSFPYQVGIIFNEEDGKTHKRFVEITMVYHTLRGLAAMRDKGEEPPLNMGMIPEYQSKMSICNYRFIREFTKGVESDWTINLLNHFKPSDYIQ